MNQKPVEHPAPPVPEGEIHWGDPLPKLIHSQEWRNMSGCNLSEIPVAKLRHDRPPVALNLDHNHLIDLPVGLGQVTSLVSLSLNSQTAIPRASISKRRHLQRLPEDVGRLPKLRMLLLCQNNVDRLPVSLARTNVLCVLDLRLNNLQNFPMHVCAIQSLQQLFLSGNEICEIPEAIGDLTHLEVLHVANNRLFRLPDSIGSLRRLRTLSLRQNQLTRLPKDFARLSQLGAPRTDRDGQAVDGLFLANNPWEYPPGEVVERGTTHVFQYLRTHDVPSSEKWFTVTVSNRHLTQLGRLPGDPTNISCIDARENKLREIPPEATAAPNLKKLILDRNLITKLGADTLKKMRSLTMFSVQNQEEITGKGDYYERLQSISEIVVCENLTELYIGHNWITSLPQGLENLRGLRVIDMPGNGLREFPARLCERLLALEFLGLSNNYLQKIPSEIGCLTKLKVLRLSKNKLRELPKTICQLSHLHTLSVRENDLVYLPLDLHKLQRLRGDERFEHFYQSFPAELRVGTNPSMNYPSKSICDQGTAAIFDFFSRLERDPQERETVKRHIRHLMDDKRSSSKSRH